MMASRMAVRKNTPNTRNVPIKWYMHVIIAVQLIYHIYTNQNRESTTQSNAMLET